MSPPRPYVPMFCPYPNGSPGGCWGIRGAWKTVNSTMGFYPSRDAAQRAIDTMQVTVRPTVKRKVQRYARQEPST